MVHIPCLNPVRYIPERLRQPLLARFTGMFQLLLLRQWRMPDADGRISRRMNGHALTIRPLPRPVARTGGQKDLKMDKRLNLAGPDIVFEEFDGDLVVLNLTTGRYFGFNPAASVLWSALAAGACPADLQAELAAGIGLATFIAALHENALVIEGSEAPAALTDEQRAQLAGLTANPVLEIYDDLSDLIVADPIHDTDETQGWPVRPNQR